MAIDKDIKLIGVLMIVLLGLMIIVGTVYLISSKYQASLCTAEDSDYVWNAGECQASSSNATEVALDSITKTDLILDAVGVVIGFLSILVVVAIAAILFRMVKGFMAGEGKM